MFWIYLAGIWFIGCLLVIALFYGASPRRSYCVEDEIADDQEQLDYLHQMEKRK